MCEFAQIRNLVKLKALTIQLNYIIMATVATKIKLGGNFISLATT